MRAVGNYKGVVLHARTARKVRARGGADNGKIGVPSDNYPSKSIADRKHGD